MKSTLTTLRVGEFTWTDMRPVLGEVRDGRVTVQFEATPTSIGTSEATGTRFDCYGNLIEPAEVIDP